MTQFFKVWHTGCGTPECSGNPQVTTIEAIDILKDRFPNWSEDIKSGLVTATGHPFTGNKVVYISPIVESEKALTIEQRLKFNSLDLAEHYRVEIEANWDAIPEQVLSHEPSMQAYTMLKHDSNMRWSRSTIHAFIRGHDITNVVVGEDKSVSGYDHSSETQFHFIPADL